MEHFDSDLALAALEEETSLAYAELVEGISQALAALEAQIEDALVGQCYKRALARVPRD